MAQQFNTQNLKVRTALLVFIKGSTAPLVLYVDNPQEMYEELSTAMVSPVASVIEKETNGPLKKVKIISNQIAALALQEEQYINA